MCAHINKIATATNAHALAHQARLRLLCTCHNFCVELVHYGAYLALVLPLSKPLQDHGNWLCAGADQAMHLVLLHIGLKCGLEHISYSKSSCLDTAT